MTTQVLLVDLRVWISEQVHVVLSEMDCYLGEVLPLMKHEEQASINGMVTNSLAVLMKVILD